MTDSAYFDELSAALRRAGVAEEQTAATVADLTGYLAESGTTAVEEFGPAREFAAQLAGGATGPAAGPAEKAETWTWTADIFNDTAMLAVHGDQGWEVERLDAVGRFVCRRVPGAALRWEYRREALPRGRRSPVVGQLAPEGWELCGEWFFYGYFKRPKAADAGPAASLTTLPETPARTWFLSGRGWAALAVWAVSVIVLTVGYFSHVFDMPAYAIAAVLVAGAGGALYGARRDAARTGAGRPTSVRGGGRRA
ncbi:hypothetical protein [Streptomyces sp. SP18CS02]|uniref:hypothetical protein n=1 Tax=Streptomyces sp. SP18CS02 TaxID=3002531 RepID=UPI002E7729C4|nr:hypothetical protein [Streptomyces sp. SP18CS02]MEE1757027.1 hypothetical protein [Streptomyces sp. SP18CS02]